MKFFNAIATAAVIGASLISGAPVEARNGWIVVSTTRDGNTSYVKPLQFSGRYREYLFNRSNSAGAPLKYVADCQEWRDRLATGSEWNDIMPQSIGNTLFTIVCR